MRFVPKVIVPLGLFIVKLFLIPPVVAIFVAKVPVPFITIVVVPDSVPVVYIDVKLPPIVNVFPFNMKLAAA